MRTWLPYICAVLLLVSIGCRSLSPFGKGHTPSTNDQDRITAQALAHYGQGLLYDAQAGPDSPEAFMHYTAAAQLAPGERILAARVALAALHRERPHEALPYLVAATAASPDSLDAWLDLAAAYRLTDQSAPALAAYRHAVTIAPHKTAIYLAMALVHIADDRADDAMNILREGHAQGDRPALIEAFLREHAHQTLQRGREQEAIASIEQLARWDESQREGVAIIVAELHLEAGRTAQALAAFESARAPAGNAATPHPTALTERFYLHYAAACEQADRPDQMMALLQEGLLLYPAAHRLLNFIAYSWAVENTRIPEALAAVQRALELDADNPAYLDTRGWIHFRMGQFDAALADTSRALTLYGNDPEILNHLGAIHAARGEADLAIQAWQAAVRHGAPTSPAVLSATAALRQLNAPVPAPAAPPPPAD